MCSQNQARLIYIYIYTHRVLPQTSRIILCKTSPDPIWFWLTVSAFGQMDLVWKQASMQFKSSSPLLANASQLIWTEYELDPAYLTGRVFSVITQIVYVRTIRCQTRMEMDHIHAAVTCWDDLVQPSITASRMMLLLRVSFLRW